MSNYTQCQQMPYDARIWSTVFEGIISLVIAVFGLGGNIVTMFILSRPCFNDVFHRLLATLSAFDMLFLGKMISDTTQKEICTYFQGRFFLIFLTYC